MKRILASLIAAFLAVYTPVAQTVVKAKTEMHAALAAALPFLFTWPSGDTISDDQALPATPPLPQGEVFINKLLVLNSSVGLVQTGSSLNFLSGWAYDIRNYLRVNQSAPSNPNYQAGIATDSTGAVHIYDATAGLPADVRWQHGLPLTTSGQLCVVFG